MTTEKFQIITSTASVKNSDQLKNLNITLEQATDFNEDPFKNYRYEDPFLITDPFKAKAAPMKGNFTLFLNV